MRQRVCNLTALLVSAPLVIGCLLGQTSSQELRQSGEEVRPDPARVPSALIYRILSQETSAYEGLPRAQNIGNTGKSYFELVLGLAPVEFVAFRSIALSCAPQVVEYETKLHLASGGAGQRGVVMGEIARLQAQRDATVLHYVDRVRASLGEERFGAMDLLARSYVTSRMRMWVASVENTKGDVRQ